MLFDGIALHLDVAVDRFQLIRLARSARAQRLRTASRARSPSICAWRTKRRPPWWNRPNAPEAGQRVVADLQLDRAHRQAERLGRDLRDDGARAGAEILACRVRPRTVPSGLMVVRHLLACPPPPQVLIASPSPSFTGPGPFWPRGFQFFFHSISSAALSQLAASKYRRAR